MHPHLQQGLDFDGLDLSSEDAVGDIPDDCYDSQQRLAKRRRVELIAGRCLKGNPPFLLSTSLKGPFNHNEWKNPWIEGAKVKRKSSRAVNSSTIGRPRGKNSDKITISKQSTTVKSNQAIPVAETSQIASPEISRALTKDTKTRGQEAAVRRLSEEDHSSNTTDFFSANTDQDSHHELPQRSTRWLRRPKIDQRTRLSQYMDGSSEMSPSRVRDGERPLGARGEVQLSLPKAPFGAPESPPTMIHVPDSLGPKAPATMAPSSPPHPACSTKDQLETCTMRMNENALNPSEHSQTIPQSQASTVFVYRKTGGLKGKAKNGEKTKPRKMTFTSSPIVIRNAHITPTEVQNISENKNPTEAESDFHVDSVATGETLVQQTPFDDANKEINNLPTGSGSSPSKIHVDDYSTQAAMMMAHQEFQEGTFPSTLSATLRAHPETEESVLPTDSPATMTPLPALNSRPDNNVPPESMLRGPPISTQDLFTAASPFAFSTLKRRTERSQPSGLRMSLLSNEEQNDEESRDGDASTKSQTPTVDRVPLKERNSTLSFRSTASMKTSQSQDSPYHNLRDSPSHVELPQLDFHTSLDEIGPNGDLAFTDQFLSNLNAMI